MSYSQNDEEEAIVRFFGTTPGRFLDVGAYDGLTFSNTRRLLELGWRGVMVEPSAPNFVRLIENMKPFAGRVIMVQAAVSENHSQIHRLYMDEAPERGWCHTISKECWDSGSVTTPSSAHVLVPTISMGELEDYGPFDFISIDAEWEDVGILKGWDNKKIFYACRLLCVEKGPAPSTATFDAARLLGFNNVVHQTPENYLLSK